jgi:hypothetical protein
MFDVDFEQRVFHQGHRRIERAPDAADKDAADLHLDQVIYSRFGPFIRTEVNPADTVNALFRPARALVVRDGIFIKEIAGEGGL